MNEKFLHALNLVPGIHYLILGKLWRAFRSWGYVWEKTDLKALIRAGLGETFAIHFISMRKKIDPEEAFEALWQEDIVPIGQDHPEFPNLLLQIPDPPFLLYRKGAELDSSKKHIAIVGTRKSTFYGEKITTDLAKLIAEKGGIVVSGLAFGIDAKAHHACVQMQKSTIAVLASGLQKIMPPAHTQLSERILATGGTLLSEYPHDLGFHKARYHERNRLISGLSMATLVMEADQKSGALITANKALEQGRDIYALPGDINKNKSRGCLQLIANGAYPIINIFDTMEKLGFGENIKKNYSIQSRELSNDEKLLLDKIIDEPATTETLLKKLNWPVERLSILISSLELKNLIQKNRAFEWEGA